MRALTGIKPTGTPHLGNLLGAIRPAIALTATHDAFYFIADYHALTSTHDAAQMRKFTTSVAATWMALGLDTSKATLFQQSDVPEVTELAWVLACVTGLGHLERAHAFKAARDVGAEINVGTFLYPVLMAADILLYDSNIVPVGQDQRQHVEMARDMAIAFNHHFGDGAGEDMPGSLVVPEVSVQANVATVVGLDGRKMSKSYNNTIPLFLPSKPLLKLVKSIETDSKSLEEPKDPSSCNVFALYKLFASAEESEGMAGRYRAGGLGYGHAKLALFEVLERELGPARERYDALMADPSVVEGALEEGGARARKVARATLGRVRERCGFPQAPRGT